MAASRHAVLYRMVLPEHTCPFGVHAKQLLEQHGYTIDEHILRSRAEVDAFEAKEDVETTPQVYIDGERIGGSDDLEDYFASREWPPSCIRHRSLRRAGHRQTNHKVVLASAAALGPTTTCQIPGAQWTAPRHSDPISASPSTRESS